MDLSGLVPLFRVGSNQIEAAGLMRPTKVLHISPARFAPGGIIGGGERYAFELARHMADFIPTKLVTFGDNERTENIGNLEVRVIGQPLYVRAQHSNPI